MGSSTSKSSRSGLSNNDLILNCSTTLTMHTVVNLPPHLRSARANMCCFSCSSGAYIRAKPVHVCVRHHLAITHDMVLPYHGIIVHAMADGRPVPASRRRLPWLKRNADKKSRFCSGDMGGCSQRLGCKGTCLDYGKGACRHAPDVSTEAVTAPDCRHNTCVPSPSTTVCCVLHCSSSCRIGIWHIGSVISRTHGLRSKFNEELAELCSNNPHRLLEVWLRKKPAFIKMHEVVRRYLE